MTNLAHDYPEYAVLDTAQSKRLDLGAKAVGFLDALMLSGAITPEEYPVFAPRVRQLIRDWEATFEAKEAA